MTATLDKGNDVVIIPIVTRRASNGKEKTEEDELEVLINKKKGSNSSYQQRPPLSGRACLAFFGMWLFILYLLIVVGKRAATNDYYDLMNNSTFDDDDALVASSDNTGGAVSTLVDNTAKMDPAVTPTNDGLTASTATSAPATATAPGLLPHLTKEELMNPIDLAANQHVPVDYQGENLASIVALRKLFTEARNKYKADLKEMYGDNNDKLFTILNEETNKQESIGKDHILMGMSKWRGSSDDKDWKFFVQKMKLKLVQVQLKFLQQQQTPQTTMTRFVHLHGGHSAGAAHGNFFHESYTAELERRVQPILRSIGINYVGKNLGAGGTSSAPEVALCTNQYFGKEADLTSWDYGMLDGKDRWKVLLYTYRAALRSQLPPASNDITDIPSRPAMMVFHAGNQMRAAFFDTVKRGMPVLLENEDIKNQHVIENIPDMNTITSDAEAEAMPPYLRNFKCNGGLEVHEPCGAHKYNTTACLDRRHRASWHPGWKVNALRGNLMAISFLDAMEEAMDQLTALEYQAGEESKEQRTERLQKLFNELNESEQKQFDSFIASELPEQTSSNWKGWIPQIVADGINEYIDYNAFFKNHSMCRMAKLPSDARFRGFLTEDFTETTINAGVERRFYRGMIGVMKKEKEEGIIVTNTEPNRKDDFILTTEKEEECEIPTYLDNRDTFYLSSLHGWRGTVIPNDSEHQYYSEFDPKHAYGYIMMCPVPCAWGKCPPEDLLGGFRHPNDPPTSHGRLEIKVNDVLVSKIVNVGSWVDCKLLKHDTAVGEEDKQFVWQPNADGRYDIRARIANATDFGFFRFSSFIIV